MPSSYRGTGTRLGSGAESSWGTAVARAVWNHVMSATGFASKSNTVERPYLAAVNDNGLPNVGYQVELAIDVTPHVQMPMRYRGMGHYLKALLGTAVDTGVGDPYTHTFTLADPDVYAPLTLEYVRGDSTYSEVFEGCTVTKGVITLSARQIGTLDLDFICEKANAARGAAGTPTDGDLVEVLGHQVGTIGWNSGTYSAKRIVITVDRTKAAREFLGSLYTAEPKATGPAAVTIEATIDVDDALYTAWLAGTSADLTIVCTGTGTDVMTVTAQNCRIMGQDALNDDIRDHGIQEMTVKWTCHADVSGGGGFAIAIQNADSTWDAN